MEEFGLVLGLPHTNHLGFAEHLLIAYAGHFQWLTIARAIGRPLSALRTATGGRVYGTFFYVDLRFPQRRSNHEFQLDDHLRFLVRLRAFKGISIEGRIFFDYESALPQGLDDNHWLPNERLAEYPSIHFGNIFITPEAGNSRLRVAIPANADFSALPTLPNEENPYHLTRQAAQDNNLGLLQSEWVPIRRQLSSYAIDPDRDSNGAGLVYFSNYVAFMARAEREALAAAGLDRLRAPIRPTNRRRIAYYGNVPLDGAIQTEVSLFERREDPQLLGLRYTISRADDGQLICLSEAIKFLA